MRLTQDAQVMPSMGSWISAVGRWLGRHTPREYTRPVDTDPWSRHTRARAATTRVYTTLAGGGVPFRVAATDTRRRGRGLGAGPRARSSRRSDRGSVAMSCRRSTSMPTILRRQVLDAAVPPITALLRGGPSDDGDHPDRPGRPPGLRSARARGGPRRSAGARPRATGASPGGSARRAPRGPSAVRSGRNPISLLIPCHRIIAGGRDARWLRRRRLDRSRPAAVAQGGAAPARRRHGAATRWLDSADRRGARRGSPGPTSE